MHDKTMLILGSIILFAHIASAAADGAAVLIPQDFSKRSVHAGGGWALTTGGACPADTTACGSECCPNSLVCDGLNDNWVTNACCPDSMSFYFLLRLNPPIPFRRLISMILS
jgi:hypothetical protein